MKTLHLLVVASLYGFTGITSAAEDADAILKLVEPHKTLIETPAVPQMAEAGGSRAAMGPLYGNGDIGITITGKPEEQVYWVAKNDFWWLLDGAAVPLSFATLKVSAPSMVGAKYSAQQSLAEAVTTTTLIAKDSTLVQRTYVSATSNLVVLNLSCSGKAIDIKLKLDPTGYKKNYVEVRTGNDKNCRWLTRKLEKGVDIPSQASAAWKIIGTEAGETPGATEFTLKPDKPVTVLLSMATQFENPDAEKLAKELLADVDLRQLEQKHRAWWRQFYAKSFVDIPDEKVMHLYYVSQYLMGSASRNPKFPPAIIGPWITNGAGWCGYWMNYNHAAPYYGLYSSNHIEQADPQDQPMLEFIPTGKKYAREILKCKGVLYCVGIGPLGLNACGDRAGLSDRPRDRRWERGITTWGQRSNAAYNLPNMGVRWRSTHDPEYAKKIYPFVMEIVNFWDDYLVLEGDRYVINDESVHEGSGFNKNPISSLGLVRNAMRLALEMSEEMGVDQPRRAKWQDIINRLSAFPTMELRDGSRIFKLTEEGPTHFRTNTVFIQHIYPAGQIGLDSDPEQLKIGQKSISYLKRLFYDGNGSNSFFPAAARVGYDPMDLLKTLRGYPMNPNGMAMFGIENCSTVPNTLNEMLMQSHENIIRFFPVWPMDMDARFGDLRAYGAFLVSAEMKDGVVSGVKIVSERGRKCTVQNPWPGKSVQVTRNGKPAETVTGERFAFKTAAGDVIELSSKP